MICKRSAVRRHLRAQRDLCRRRKARHRVALQQRRAK